MVNQIIYFKKNTILNILFKKSKNAENKLCLVCSSGGHFEQLYSLKEFWSEFDRFWITFPSRDKNILLNEEEVYFGYFPTNRSIKNLLKNFFFAIKIIYKTKPDFIISTGAGICVPFFYAGKLLKVKLIFIESLTRVDDLSLTGRMVYPISDIFLVQWPELSKKYKKAAFKGSVL